MTFPTCVIKNISFTNKIWQHCGQLNENRIEETTLRAAREENIKVNYGLT